MGDERVEHDSLGQVRVPAERYWGAQTQRSLEHFPIGRERFVWGRPVIRALGLLKKSAALANGELGQLPAGKVDLIARAAQEVVDGRLDDEFPLVVFQTGSGTHSNMNANEVIAGRANELAGRPRGGSDPIHPNDDVNRGQSSNDTFPTVMHVATVEAVTGRLLPAAGALLATMRAKADDYDDVVMLARTHWQDATPIRLGQVIGSWASQLDGALRGVEATLPALSELAVGGTAVGTGLNCHPRFAEVASRLLSEETGHTFVPAGDKVAALAAHDAMIAASAALRTLAVALFKTANDVRRYASGPRGGLGELHIPENEPGSSIMPGKVNPTQTEALMQVCVHVFGNDAAVAFAGSQGEFQLNVFKPVILHNVLESALLLADAVAAFDHFCARGLEPDRERIAEHLRASLMLVTALSPHVGYERAALIAQRAHETGRGLREAAVELGYATGEEFDRWVVPAEMTHPADADGKA
jgi:fumarate hydratase class II